MTDLLLQLADGLVSAISAQYPAPTVVEWIDDPYVELQETDLAETLIWVVDIAEETSTENALRREDRDLLIVIQRKKLGEGEVPEGTDLAEANAARARELSGLAGELVNMIRPIDGSFSLRVGDDDEAVCFRTVRRPARNLGEWHEKRRHYAEILTSWRRM